MGAYPTVKTLSFENARYSANCPYKIRQVQRNNLPEKFAKLLFTFGKLDFGKLSLGKLSLTQHRDRYQSVSKNVRYQELSVVSHKQEHECAASKVVCAMSSGRYLNLRARGSPFDHSRLARRMANLDKQLWIH